MSTNMFPEFAEKIALRFKKLAENRLFIMDIPYLDELYLAAFPENTDPLFRVNTEHNCNTDKYFIRKIGNVVAIIDGKIETIWGCYKELPYPYNEVAKYLDEKVKSGNIDRIFCSKEDSYGRIQSNVMIDDQPHTFYHFHCDVPTGHRHPIPGTRMGYAQDSKSVLKRGLTELTEDAIESVTDLLKNNSLYRGTEFQNQFNRFKELYRKFPRNGTAKEREIFAWSHYDNQAAKFRNSVLGNLVVDLSKGTGLEDAVRKYESQVAPENYKRPNALITPKMIEKAVSKLDSIGLSNAVKRRHANTSDLSVNDVLFVNNETRMEMKDGLTSLLMEEVKSSGKVTIDNPEEITADYFLNTVVPKASTIELLVESDHLSNFMSITAPVDPDVDSLFKWGNSFAWSYDGDIADSSIKTKVKKAGGNIDADMRISLGWENKDDLDIHCECPRGHIYYGYKMGILDVDMNVNRPVRGAVENLSFNKPKDGTYKVYVNNYTRRESVDVGFTIEFEFYSKLTVLHCPVSPAQNKNINCFELVIKKGQIHSFTITDDKITSNEMSTDKWGIKTQQLVPVNMLMLSPNYWEEGNGTGNKHLFFILNNCKNPDEVRGIYNEFLRSDLEEHRKVFEVLGGKTKCQYSDEQLSGIGFSSTRENKATIVVKGNNINKAFNVQF